MNDMSAEYIRSILYYNPDTGEFFWKKRADATVRWNGQFSGKKAGSIGSLGYLKITINDRTYLGHRVAWIYVTGAWPLNEIDHRDGNPSNNRWDNLRTATRQQNQQNRKRHKSNSSGFKGVSKNRSGITWAAAIYKFGRKIHVGNFPTAEAAHVAYCAAAKLNYGEFTRVA